MENKYKKEVAKLIAKAWTDPAFKKKLLSSPKEAFLEFGIPCPQGVNLHVHENTKKDWHFQLPMKPTSEMSEEELKKAAGGTADAFGSATLGSATLPPPGTAD